MTIDDAVARWSWAADRADPRGPLGSLSPLCQRRPSPVVNSSRLTTNNTTSTRNTIRLSRFAHRAHSTCTQNPVPLVHSCKRGCEASVGLRTERGPPRARLVLCPPCQRRLSTNNAHIACATTYRPHGNTEHSTRNTVHGETRRHHAPSREGGAGERGGRGRFGSGWLPWARSRPLLDRPHMWGDPLGSPRGAAPGPAASAVGPPFGLNRGAGALSGGGEAGSPHHSPGHAAGDGPPRARSPCAGLRRGIGASAPFSWPLPPGAPAAPENPPSWWGRGAAQEVTQRVLRLEHAGELPVRGRRGPLTSTAWSQPLAGFVIARLVLNF